MTVELFIEQYPAFFSTPPESSEAWKRVYDRAKQHSRYVSKSELTRKNRPNEPERIKEYRDDNLRRITLSMVNKFKTKTARIIKTSGFSIDFGSLSKKLLEWLESNPYSYLNQRSDFDTFIFENVYSHSVDDPNAVNVQFPYFSGNPTEPPSLFNPANKSISIDSLIIPSERIRYFDRNLFAWESPNLWPYTAGDKTKYAPYYYLVDLFDFYQYIPVGEDKGEIKYELRHWYFHDTGEGNQNILPVNLMAGTLSFDEDGHYAYQLSILQPAFEYFDEYVSRYSDGQAVWVNHAHPISVMEETVCANQGCNMGMIQVNGKPTKCPNCDVNGMVKRPSPHGLLIKKEKRGLDSSANGKVYEVIVTPTDSLKATYEIPKDILKQGNKALGLDALEMVAESSLAMAMRQNDIKEQLSDIESKLARFIFNHLYFTECLLNPSRERRMRPSVNRAVDFEIKNAAQKRADAAEALPIDKLDKTLIYLESEYKNNESLLTQKKLILEYSPIFLLDEDQFLKRWSAGIISHNDAVKRDYAVTIFRELAKERDIAEVSKDEAFKFADKWLEDRELLKDEEEIPFNPNPNIPAENGG